MRTFHSSDPVELRALAALTSGPLSAAEVAARIGEPELVVQQALEQSLAEQAVTKIALAKAPAYSLTPKGLHAVGVDSAGHVDLGAAARDRVTTAPADTSVHHVEVNPAVRRVTWRHVVYAVLYVVIGLAVTMFQPVIGVLAILAGLGLGAWALRPLFSAAR